MTALPEPLPKVFDRTPTPEVKKSPALSLSVRPGHDGILTRRIAILVADGVDDRAAASLHQALARRGAVPRFIGVKLGEVQTTSGEALQVEISMETAPSVLWDAVALPDGQAAVALLSNSGQALEFLRDQYRHCKPILTLGAAASLLEKAAIPAALGATKPDPAVLQFDGKDLDAAVEAFASAIAKHRYFERETDPPVV